MFRAVWVFLVGISATLGILSSFAADRTLTYYRISEKSLEDVDSSPYYLIVDSSDLKKYPRSVVTFTVTTDRKASRGPAALMPAGNDKPPEKIRAKRHYTMINEGVFGRHGEPMLTFYQKSNTVFVGFVGKEGKTFYFKKVSPPSADLAQHQTQ